MIAKMPIKGVLKDNDLTWSNEINNRVNQLHLMQYN
mgnify:CR=1 FL=1